MGINYHDHIEHFFNQFMRILSKPLKCHKKSELAMFSSTGLVSIKQNTKSVTLSDIDAA